jgi:hypothetical protein
VPPVKSDNAPSIFVNCLRSKPVRYSKEFLENVEESITALNHPAPGNSCPQLGHRIKPHLMK